MSFLHYLKSSIIHPRFLANRELRNYISLEANILNGRLLDIGCGKKPYLEFIKNYDSYIGIDMPSTIHGSSKLNSYGSALALPFSDSSFDSILCTEVLEHVPNPLIALQEMYRVARPGSVLLLTVPFSEQLHEEPYDYFRYTIHGLVHLLTTSKWNILRYHNRGGAWLELGYRFSSLLYSAIGAKRDETGYLHPRLIMVLPINFICILVQMFFSLFDRIWKVNFSTIGYVVIAQK